MPTPGMSKPGMSTPTLVEPEAHPPDGRVRDARGAGTARHAGISRIVRDVGTGSRRRPATAAAPGSARRGHGHPWLTLLAVALGAMMVGLDVTVVAIANPAIARDLDADLAGLQWVTNGYMLAIAAALIVAGRLADRIGRKTLFLAGIAGFALASVAVGSSTSVNAVIFWRVGQGLAAAALQPSGLAILRNTFPAERLNIAIGVWAGTNGLAIASGPVVAGLLVEHVSWESVFFINAPVAALALALGAWVIRQSRDPQGARSFDPIGVVTLSGSLVSLVWALIKAQAYGFGDPVPLGFIGLALLLGAVLVGHERRTKDPLLPLSLFRNVSVSAGALQILLGFFALMGGFFFITLYLQQVHGLSPVEAGVRLLPMTAVVIVASPLAGLLTSRVGPRPPLVVGSSAFAVALLALSRISAGAAYGQLWPWFVVIGIGFSMVVVGGTEAIVGNLPPEMAGLAGGIQQTSGQIGGVLGTTVFGTTMSSRVGDVLPGRLAEQAVPEPFASGLRNAVQYIAQGGVPLPAGTPRPLAGAITAASHLAFMDGFRTALTIGSAVAVCATLLALLVRRRR